jgi:hypothetical protein
MYPREHPMRIMKHSSTPFSNMLLDVIYAAARWKLSRDGSNAKGLSHSQRRALQHAEWHESQAAKLRAEVWEVG